MRYQLRCATSNDLDAICALDIAAFSQPWARKSFERALDDEASLLLVAHRSEPGAPCATEKDGDIVAFGVAQVTLDECEIATLAVAPSARGLGLGATILESLLKFGAARGAARTFLEVRPSNEVARALYRKWDFQEVGRRRAYYQDGEDALILRREYSREEL